MAASSQKSFPLSQTALLYYRIEVHCFTLSSAPHQLCYYAYQKLGQKKENFERIRAGEEEENNINPISTNKIDLRVWNSLIR